MKRRRPSAVGAGLFTGLGLVVLLIPFVPGAPVHSSTPTHATNRLGAALGTGLPAARPAGTLNGYGKVSLNSSDPAIVPNTGLLANLTGYTVEPFPALSKFQLGAEETIGNYLVTFGLFQNSFGGPYPFFSVFNNSTAASVFQANESFQPVQSGAAYDFALQLANGTNWTLTLNGALFGGSEATSTFDFGVRAATDGSSVGLSEIAYAAGTVVPPRIEIPTGFAVRLASGWYLPTDAIAGYTGDPTIRWGIEGDVQNGSLVPGLVRTGTQVPSPSNGTPVWDTGPVSFGFSLSVSPPTVPGAATALITGTVRDGTGRLVAAFPLVLSDSDGAVFSQPFPSSDANGSIREELVAPNGTLNVSDTIRLGARAMGARGAATQQVLITPALHVQVRIEGPNDLGPGDSTSLRLFATLADGSAVPGLGITLFAIGGGSVSPETALTDSSGSVALTVSGPRQPATIRLYATVTTGGYWGEGTYVVSIRSVPPPLWQTYLPEIVGAAIGLVVLAVVIRWWRRRPPKQAMSPLSLPPRSGTSPAPEGPLTRTPPSAGSP